MRLHPLLRILVIPAVAMSLSAASPSDWTQFRGPQGNGIAPGARLPLNPGPRDVTWSVDLPGRGLSSPIIVGDRVFVTAATGIRQDRLHVLCFDVATGALRWQRRFWATGRTMTHEKTSVAAPTPASDGRHVFALFSSNDCVALDLDGNLVWFRGLGRDYPNASNSLGMSSSLVVVDGVLVAQVENDSESFTVGIETATGVNRWRLDRPRMANWTSPSLLPSGGRTLVILQSGKGLSAVDPADGREVWAFDNGASTIPSTTVADGRLFVPSRGLTALEPAADGSAPRQLWQASTLRPDTSSPVVFGGRTYTLNSAGVLTCGDAADGRRVWQLRLKGPFSATPVVAGGHLYCVNEKGVLQVVDPSAPEGAVVGEQDLGQTVLATPSIAGNALYIRSDRRLWRLVGSATVE